MARAQRKKAPSVFAGNGEAKPPVRVIPEMCPICSELLSTVVDEAIAHLNSHAPAELCQRCEVTEKGWRLDLDGVRHFRPDVSLFYCSGCGRYGPLDQPALGA